MGWLPHEVAAGPGFYSCVEWEGAESTGFETFFVMNC